DLRSKIERRKSGGAANSRRRPPQSLTLSASAVIDIGAQGISPSKAIHHLFNVRIWRRRGNAVAAATFSLVSRCFGNVALTEPNFRDGLSLCRRLERTL